jgi:DNA repair protein RecN (Recombination protein N)
MLRQLSIKNFAIVESVTLEFAQGFNVLTGETGAGKSLIVDALYFLLGDRISADMLRAGEDRAVVEALFQLLPMSSAGLKLAEWGIACDNGEMLIKREFSRSSSKTRSFINGEMATASMISELGDMLIDIHGQHEHQAIFNITKHRQLIDAYGHLDTYLKPVSEAYKTLSGLLDEQSRLGGDSREIARRTDLLKFQADEIAAARLTELNEEELLKKYQMMKQAEKITKLLTEAQQALDEDGDGGATGLFGHVIGRLQDASRLDQELENMIDTGKALQESLNQLSFDLARKIESYSFTEAEFEDLSDKIDGLNTLKKKYGESVAEIIKYHDNITEELKVLLGREGRLETLGKEIEKAADEYQSAAKQLTQQRVKVGTDLAKKVQEALKELGLPHAKMSVQVNPIEDASSPAKDKGKSLSLSATGWDRVEFLFSANPGEPLRPLAKVASGGEASRVMLALKTILAGSDDVPTLIFDEIDTGVGARTASAVAELLERLATSKQILCISHLAPIAVLGECHYQVTKTFKEGKTSINVQRLTEQNRIEELAKMLGGEPVSETSRSHAKELFTKIRLAR